MFAPAKTARRRLTAAVAGVAMVAATLTSAAPSRAADADDLARALAAIAALAIIANAIDGNDRPSYRPPYNPYPPAYHPPYRPPYQPPYHPQPKPPVHGKKVLPDACRVAVVDRENRRNVYYTANCLRRAGLDNLPSRCATEVRLNGDKSRVYRDSCMFNLGYRTEYR